MNEPQILPDDPKLTAYVLDELEAGERAAVERALRLNPALRSTVDDIRAATAHIEGALAAEAEPNAGAKAIPFPAAATPASAPQPVNGKSHRHAAIIPGDDYRRLDGGPLRQMTRFPQFYYVIGGLAAACFAVMVALQGPPPVRTVEKKHYVEVPLTLPAPQAGDAPKPIALPPASALVATVATEEGATAGPTSLAGASGAGGTSVFVPQGGLLAEAKTTMQAWDAQRGGELLRENFSGSPQDLAARAFAEARRSLTEPPTQRIASGPNSPVTTTSATPVPSGAPSLRLASSAVNTGAGGRLDRPFSGVRAAGARGLASNAGGFFSPVAGGASIAPFSRVDLFPGSRRAPREELNTERYAYQKDNPFVDAAQNPLSTFSVDVDTASYTNVRRFIEGGALPPADAVRIEELVNYFTYRYPPPAPAAAAATSAAGPRREGVPPPFAASLEVASAPWAPEHRLLRIGLKGRAVAAEARPAANLVFLVDVSGSMNEANKLPLVQEALRLLVGKLRRDDSVAIVTYAGKSGLALPATPVAKSREILAAIDELTAGGSTNGASGIQLAYDIAKAHARPGGISRVVLCTDGDFNVGVSNNQGELTRLIEEKAKSGVFLTVLGFGMGNLQDATLEALADKGNGFYGYIDTRKEAERLLVDQLSSTLVTIAKDVKLQVDFNPAKVASYRLIGYENRQLQKEDFANDKIDAGEIGAGHTVTALYEIVLVGATSGEDATPLADESKYQPRAALRVPAAVAHELLTLKIRYKEPTGDVSQPLEFPLVDAGTAFAAASADFKFAAAVAGFGMLLRDSPHKGTATIGDVIAWAATGAANPADDPAGYRSDFLGLARQAQVLMR